MQRCNILAGDFNLHHNHWDSRTINPTPAVRQFADWVSEVGGVYGLPISTKTHQQGGCISLVITSSALSTYIYKCYVEEKLDVTSNHSAIITTLSIGKRPTGEQLPRKFRFQKMDDKLFYKALQSQQDALGQVLEKASKIPRLSENRKKALDSCTEQLLKAIHQSVTVSIPKTKISRKGEPWWDQECQLAVVKLKNLCRTNSLKISYQIENPMQEEKIKAARKALRKVVKHAKRCYY